MEVPPWTASCRTAHLPLRKGARTIRHPPRGPRQRFNQIGLGAEDRWYKDEEGLALIERIGATPHPSA